MFYAVTYDAGQPLLYSRECMSVQSDASLMLSHCNACNV